MAIPSSSQIHGEDVREDLPRVLVVKPPTSLARLGDGFFASNMFKILKAFESPLSLPEFLAEHSSYTISAVIAPGYAPLTPDVFRLLPDLRLVVSSSAGFDHVDIVECRRRGISVVNNGPSFSPDIADTAVGLLIDVFRRISAANRFVKQGLWPVKGDYPLGSRLGGKRISIVGMGSIGKMIATRLEAFGCKISYNSRTQKPSLPYTFYTNVQEMAVNSDALVISCELNKETRHLINKYVLSALGKQGVIVNIARGAVIDEKELVRCLIEGEIAGAGLDVFEHEPKIPKELFELENVVMSPHTAFLTREGLEESAKVIVGNIEAFLSNKPLLSPIFDARQSLN